MKNQEPEKRYHVKVSLIHGHVMTLIVPESRLPVFLKQLEEAVTGKKAIFFRDPNNAAPNTMLDGRTIVSWETNEEGGKVQRILGLVP